MRTERAAGFTLVEVLVALVVAGLLSAILLDAQTQARARVRHAEEQRRAVFLARALLTRAMTAPFYLTPQGGTSSRLRWSLTEQVVLPDPRGQYGLIGFRVTVLNERGQTLFAGRARRLMRMPRS